MAMRGTMAVAIAVPLSPRKRGPRVVGNPAVWRLAAAGGVAGAIANCVLFPLDTVKTVRQADPSRFPGVLPAALGILRTRGLPGLYAGIMPAILGSALSSALYFGTYEYVRRIVGTAVVSPQAVSTVLQPQEQQLQRNLQRKGRVEAGVNDMYGKGSARRWPVAASPERTPILRIPLNALAAASGNIVSSILFVPKEVVKQRMQAGVDSGRFLGAAVGLVRADGISGLYRGYKATLLRNIPSTMLRFAMYEEAKLWLQSVRGLWLQRLGRRQLTPADGMDKSRRLSQWEHIGAGAISGALASAITTPMDVIKTRFATDQVRLGHGIVHVVADILREQGVGGLYVGIRPRVVWSALFAAIGFSSYEMCKELFLPADSNEHSRQ